MIINSKILIQAIDLIFKFSILNGCKCATYLRDKLSRGYVSNKSLTTYCIQFHELIKWSLIELCNDVSYNIFDYQNPYHRMC